MTRKDFELIAETIRTSQNFDTIGRELFANEMAYTLAGTNVNFDRDRFVKACGV